MLMIGTEELVQHLYEAWRERMDVVRPRRDDYGIDIRPRRKWEHIDSNEKSVWRDVARAAASKLVDAMNATPIRT